MLLCFYTFLWCYVVKYTSVRIDISSVFYRVHFNEPLFRHQPLVLLREEKTVFYNNNNTKTNLI
jgi:hypothetical protein